MAQSIQTKSYSALTTVAESPDGSVVVGGYYVTGDAWLFDSITVPATTSNRAIVAKYSSNGSLLWIKYGISTNRRQVGQQIYQI